MPQLQIEKLNFLSSLLLWRSILVACVFGRQTWAAVASATTTARSRRDFDDDLNAVGILQDVILGGTASNQYVGPPQPLLLIGAGLPRTSTASFQKAMKMLGYHCYHMKVAMMAQGHLSMWHEHLHQQSLSLDDLMGTLAKEGFNATVDIPVAFKYKELIETYPHAKVILTLRSEASEELAAQKWADSMTNTVLKVPPLAREFWWLPGALKFAEMLEASYGEGQLPVRATTIPSERDKLPAYYQAWNKEVLQTVPAERLLVFRAKDGWEPLCDFLLPLSNDIIERNCDKMISAKVPFPHVNDTSKVLAVYRLFYYLNIASKILLVSLLVKTLRFSLRKFISESPKKKETTIDTTKLSI